MFWKKQREIEEMVLEHVGFVDATFDAFKKALTAYLGDRDLETAETYALETHRMEGKADDARRRVETQMLAGSLLPTSRRDILQIIDQVDRLANAAEEILDYLLLQRVDIPPEIQSEIGEIAELSDRAFDEAKAAVGCLFRKSSDALEHTQAIEHLEGDVDHLERRVTKRLFGLDIDLAQKLQVSGFLQRLVRLSDRAEDLSDLIELIVAARRV
jgi:predicted phosphate transport protein (TIGR00153 family)